VRHVVPRSLVALCAGLALTPAAAEAGWHEPVGGPSPINSGDAFHGPSTASIGGVPYVAWDESDGTNFEVRVARLNQAGTAWEQVVGGPSPINHDPDRAAFASSLTSIGGVPYVGWREFDGSASKIRISRLEPELSQPEALATDSGAVLLARVRTHGVAYPLRFEYGPGSSLGNSTAITTSSGDQGTDTVFKTIGGLAPATAHSFRAIGFDGTYEIAPGTTTQFTTLAQNGPGPAGAAGPPGEPGSSGPPGPTGAQGEPAIKLLVAVVNPKLTARVGRRVTVNYLSTATGSTTLEVFKGRKRISRTTGRAKVGRNKVAWNGKLGRKSAKPGPYTLKLSVTGGDGQAANDRAKLTVRR
jgi:hypothetical protein